MPEVTIVADESGTMPADDCDRPFCVAAIATVGTLPGLTSRNGHRNEVLKACTAAGMVQQVVYVRPTPGYGHHLQSKTSKMTTMARASRLITGSHAYLPDQGYNPRNLVWIRCVAVCLARAVLRAATAEAIERVSVALDRKTFTGQERALFADRVREQSQDLFGRGSHRYGVTVTWSDNSEATAFEDGLFLAHHLSRMAREALEAGIERSLAEELSVPLADLFYDATRDVVAALPRWSVERWKSRTGLPEPSG